MKVIQSLRILGLKLYNQISFALSHLESVTGVAISGIHGTCVDMYGYLRWRYREQGSYREISTIVRRSLVKQHSL